MRNLQQFGKRVIIAFDRHEDVQNGTKNIEHIRAREFSSPDYDLNINTRVPNLQSASWRKFVIKRN